MKFINREISQFQLSSNKQTTTWIREFIWSSDIFPPHMKEIGNGGELISVFSEWQSELLYDCS